MLVQNFIVEHWKNSEFEMKNSDFVMEKTESEMENSETDLEKSEVSLIWKTLNQTTYLAT